MQKRILATFLGLSLSSGSLTLALDNPAIPQPAPGVAEQARPPIAAETAAAISALGASPSAKQISAIVFKAVRSSPDHVLPIVDAAVRVSPHTAAPEIVTAATAAVPNPWKQVSYRKIGLQSAKVSRPDFEGEPDYKSGPDGKQARDGGPTIDLGGRHAGEPGTSFSDGSQMTLAEAIVRTASDAQPGVSLFSLQAAVNAALLSDPATLMRYIQSPIVTSGVGNAGFSNYANEPLRPNVLGTTPLPTPQQPVVSR